MSIRIRFDRPIRFALAVATMLACLPSLAIAADGLTEPQQVVASVHEQLTSVLRRDRGRLRDDPGYVNRIVDEIFVPHLDVNGVSALVLGRYWRTATPDQKEGFIRELKRLLIQTYSTALIEIGVEQWDMVFLPPREIQGKTKRVVVRTQIVRAGAKPASIDFSMRYDGKQWLTYDVKVEGVSLLANYRSSFSRMAAEKGLDGLIADLTARNDAHRQGS